MIKTNVYVKRNPLYKEFYQIRLGGNEPIVQQEFKRAFDAANMRPVFEHGCDKQS